MQFSKKFINYVVVVLVVETLCACNSSTSSQLPPNASVRVSPETITWNIPNNGGVCNYDPNYYQDEMVSIMVQNESGTYIPDAPLMITLDLAANTFSGTPVMALYDDKNGNGVADGPNELVTDTNSGAFTASTDKVSGYKYVILRINLSCPYTGTLSALSDGYLGSVSIIVQEKT